MSTIGATELNAIKRQAAAIQRSANALDAKRKKKSTKPAVKKSTSKSSGKKKSGKSKRR